jgi:hypothetical protein
LDDESLGLLTRVLNTAMLLVLAAGLLYRFRPRAHIPLMLTAFVGDLVNVFLVEVYSRRTSEGTGAVEKGIGAFAGEADFLSRFHIIVSTLCILGYVAALATGIRLLRRGTGRRAHRVNAFIFIVTRLSSYVTSFWM